jgi:hypothetical protein
MSASQAFPRPGREHREGKVHRPTSTMALAEIEARHPD